jgi:hypothetical protein
MHCGWYQNTVEPLAKLQPTHIRDARIFSALTYLVIIPIRCGPVSLLEATAALPCYHQSAPSWT